MHNAVYKVSEKPIEDFNLSEIEDTWFVREVCDWYEMEKYIAASRFSYGWFVLMPKFEHEEEQLTVTFPKDMLELWKKTEFKRLRDAVVKLYNKVSSKEMCDDFMNGEWMYDSDAADIRDVAFGERYDDYVIFKNDIMPISYFLRMAHADRKYYMSPNVIDYNW